MELDKFIENGIQYNKQLEEDFSKASGNIFTEANQDILRKRYRLIAENAVMRKREEIGERALRIMGKAIFHMDIYSRQDALSFYSDKYNMFHSEQKEILQEMLLSNGKFNQNDYEEGIKQLAEYGMHLSVLFEFMK